MTETNGSGVTNVLLAIDSRFQAEKTYCEARANVAKHFGIYLRWAREDLTMTQHQLADVLGVTATYISKIENGGADAGLPMMIKLQAYLKEQST